MKSSSTLIKLTLRYCCVAISLFAMSGIVSGQDILTKGGISGTVVDPTGASIPNAKIVITGPTDEKTIVASSTGRFDVSNLIPGMYKLKIEQNNFKTATVPDVVVYVGKITSLRIALETGRLQETIEISAGTATIDTSSTAIGSNLNDQLYENLPIQRSLPSLFYLTPGVNDSLMGSGMMGQSGGAANPSISGGSALDNLFIADGVNITDASFGGLGVFSRVYGTLGVGINTSFIKEVQVKTGGFEPQFGQAQGGIVNIITKSGTKQYHGGLAGYFRPDAFEATRNQIDDVRTNKVGKVLAQEEYDVNFELGGPIPGSDKVFFFGSYNPTVRRQLARGAEGSGLRTIFGDQTHRRFFSQNYAFKTDYNVTDNHQVNFSVFGDPTETNKAPFNTLNIDNQTANSILDFGTRNLALRYNGTLSNSWTVSASFGQGLNRFNEYGFDNFAQITDFTGSARGAFTPIGLGFYEPYNQTTYRGDINTQKLFSFLDSHTFGTGYQYQRAYYDGRRERSGLRFSVPATNVDGLSLGSIASVAARAVGVPGSSLNGTFQLLVSPIDEETGEYTCTLCPLMNVDGAPVPVYLLQDRGEFGSASFSTESKYHAAYAQDTWKINRFITALAGLRWEQERLTGSPGATQRLSYTFTGNWSPRVGATVDPFGKGKTKFYYNFGRFHEYIPLDLAERSLSAELGFVNAAYLPDFTLDGATRRVKLNQFGTVTPLVDSEHMINFAEGGIASGIGISRQDPRNFILPGTKLGYMQEHLIGFEQQLPGNMVMSVKYINRNLKRIVEDAAVVSPESFALFGQTYFIGNVNASMDAAVNPIGFKYPVGGARPTQCDPLLDIPAVTDSAGRVVGAICYAALGKNGQPAGDSGADGVPDGFPDPVHTYHGVEIELNKRFSNNWQLLGNWRIAKLQGNFEGHFRNDNGQTDPAISSLFDFTGGDFNLLGNQFDAGYLNTDRRHVVNLYGSYAFGNQGGPRRLKGLNLGGGLHLASGVPISEFLAHPAYLNSGEIPVGGRGKLGRTDFYKRVDLHVDYPFSLSERVKLSISANFFNITNAQDIRLPDQNKDLSVGVPNEDYGKPLNFRPPFNMYMGVKLSF